MTDRLQYDTTAKVFHWLIVALLTAQYLIGWFMPDIHRGMKPGDAMTWHISVGMVILALIVLRLLWRLTHAKLPPFPASMSWLHRAVVQLSEYALYALLLVQPVTGMAATLLRGRQFALFFWHVPPLMSESRTIWISLEGIHEIGACAFGALILGHAAAALFHHFVLRDDVLECMAPVIATDREDVLPGRVAGGVSP